MNQHKNRIQNHPSSAASKHSSRKILQINPLTVDDCVYLYVDRGKSHAGNRYLVVSIDGDWCFITKFVGNQLRASSYKIKTSDCYRVPNEKAGSVRCRCIENSDSNDEVEIPTPPSPVDIPAYLLSLRSILLLVIQVLRPILLMITRTPLKFLFF